jgi:hypothetical protein
MLFQVGQASTSFDPHPSQNDASARLSLLHFVQSIWLSTKLVEQRLGLLQVGGVEALSEPVVGWRRCKFLCLSNDRARRDRDFAKKQANPFAPIALLR